MENKPKIIVILGQTATGKSTFAVQVAKKIGGEIISADSRQVYKGMDLGTGKITKREMQGIPHHLLDVVNPKKIFSVSDYKKLADKKIKEILKRGHVPILCGGTGFYIDTVVNGTILPEVPPNKKLRITLSKKSAEQLFKMLQKLDPVRANSIDKNNPVRLIRAIEIAKTLGKVPPLSPKQGLREEYSVVKIGLRLPDEILKERIHSRLLARIKKGMLREIENLHSPKQGLGLTWKRMNELGLEYRYGALYLQGKLGTTSSPLSAKQEMIEKLNTEIWHYAKRQKTWFKRDKEIIWIDSRKNSEKIRVLKSLKYFLK